MAQEIIVNLGIPITLTEAQHLQRALVELPDLVHDAGQALEGLSQILSQDVVDPALLSRLLALASRAVLHMAEEHQEPAKALGPRLHSVIEEGLTTHAEAIQIEAERNRKGKTHAA